MDRRVPIVYGVTGQTIEFYPPEYSEGVPSGAATFKVWSGGNSNDAGVEFEGTATMDTTSLALDGAAGYSQPNRKRVPLAATTGLVALTRRYVIENARGQREQVRFLSIAAADFGDVEFDLGYDYATATSTVKGFRQSIAIDSTFVANLGKINEPGSPYRVEILYTIAGVARRHWVYFDLVRAGRQHGVCSDDLYRAAPWLRGQEDLDRIGQGYQPDIDEGARVFWRDCDLQGVHPDTVLEGQDAHVIEAALMVIAERRTPPGQDAGQWLARRTAIYRGNLERALAGMKLRVAQEGTGAITSPGLRPMGYRS